jgi:uncharacterized protein YndB with AHSA1/START domain
MSEAVFLVDIQASPAAVRQALTTREGIVQWWTDRADVPTDVGEILELGFPEAPAPFQLRIDTVADDLVGWTSTGDFPPHWRGTEVRFHLDDHGGATRLFFEHRGFPAPDPALGHTAFTWAQLMVNLKRYLEGEGAGPMFVS